MSAIKAWAIISPEGNLVQGALSDYSETNAWCYFGMERKDWERAKKKGYRCIRVRVEEVTHD